MIGAGRRGGHFAGVLLACATASRAAWADPTPGYPERVLQWKVNEGETCQHIATSLYGSAHHFPLLYRYNAVICNLGVPLAEGTVLVVPEKVTQLPTARLQSMTPTVKARPPGAAWSNAANGMPLFRKYSVNTLAEARADIRFRDRTRVYLAEHTLVVIYGSAGESAVAKTKPPAVELQEGEVQAGLAALRGGASVGVATQGGGLVTAASKDAVLRRKKKRTTVSVFQGKANVRSAGRQVEVPTNFGTSFVQAKPPAPPRPLPPPPVWESGSSEGVVIAPGGEGTIWAQWKPVPRAVAYRFEVARDRSFQEILLREETPKDVRAFRAEKFPAGTYYLRIRAIDDEDFLGIASGGRNVVLVRGNLDHGKLDGRRVRANPYGTLALAPPPGFQMAFDDGPFGPPLRSIDLATRRPKQIHFRPAGGKQKHTISVTYDRVSAAVRPQPSASGQTSVEVTFQGLEGIDVPGRVAPKLRVRRGELVQEVPLAATSDGAGFAAVVPFEDGPAPRFDVVDSRGYVLGSGMADRPPPEVPRDEGGPQRPPVGLTAPPIPLSPLVGAVWASTSPSNGAAASVGGDAADGENVGQGHVRATGSFGRFAVRGRVGSNSLGDARVVDNAAWLGAQWRVLGPTAHDSRDPELALGLSVGLPMTDRGLATRLQPQVGVGGLVGRWSWLANVGGRVPVVEAIDVPDGQGFVLLGGTYAVRRWLRLFSVLDAHVLAIDDSVRVRGGLAAGLEIGTRFFGNLSLRGSPWDDAGGHVFGQLSLGVREF